MQRVTGSEVAGLYHSLHTPTLETLAFSRCPSPGGLSCVTKRRPNGSEVTCQMNLIGIMRDHWSLVLVPLGFVLGCYLDRKNDEKLTAFRNKSLLYKRDLKPGEETTWK
ncbi:NADH dehydrogenase [ubiquinone] 1 beta subcomplex subunit 1 isoform X2 [Narcine bancroftii]|uniref:NADH dehydrogenase [ubiquinone] 1 beta subcomplex subunit 1 isoform X2 n=1 Tax=Narcine bancroftii TaxID=1343680 RepID=UPI003831B5D1